VLHAPVSAAIAPNSESTRAEARVRVVCFVVVTLCFSSGWVRGLGVAESVRHNATAANPAPGLVISRREEVRTAYAIGAYLGWHEHMRPGEIPLPVLRLDWREAAPFAAWRQRHRPDVIVVVLLSDALPELEQLLRRARVAVPRDLGVAVMTHSLEGTGFAGLQQNQELMGTWAVDQLVARILNRDFGVPRNPHIEMVEGRWRDGRSLGPVRRLVPAPRGAN
jgi:hypothetical protein